MKNMYWKALLLFALALSLGGCDPGEKAAAGNRAAARSAQGGTPPPRPLTNMETAQKAYEVGDRPKALQYFMAAGAEGNADAQYYAGLMFAEGQGTKKDIPKALEWYEKAAAQNQPDALVALARFYVLNVGVQEDPQKAVELFGRAAELYPPGEKKDHALEQRNALMAVLNPPPEGAAPTTTVTAPATEEPAKPAPAPSPAKSEPAGGAPATR
jgi:TPR repeat protein